MKVRPFRSPLSQLLRWNQLVVSVLLLLALSAPVLAENSAPKQGTGGLPFLVVSDWGGKGNPTQRAVAQQMGQTATKLKSRFVITCGDNYHGEGIASPESPRWKSEYEDIYTSPSLMVPWFASLGNHDNRGNVLAELAYAQKSPRWKMPARYYAHTEEIDGTNSALFVHLDTSPFISAYRKKGSPYHVQDQDPKAQLAWFESVLADSRARWKIVVGHHPIYAAAPMHGDTKELIKSVLPVLLKYGVRIYLCGHDHVLQHLVDGQLNFFVCGGGLGHRNVSERNDVRFGAGSAGFLAVRLTANEAEARFVDDQGKELYLASIPCP